MHGGAQVLEFLNMINGHMLFLNVEGFQKDLVFVHTEVPHLANPTS